MPPPWLDRLLPHIIVEGPVVTDEELAELEDDQVIDLDDIDEREPALR